MFHWNLISGYLRNESDRQQVRTGSHKEEHTEKRTDFGNLDSKNMERAVVKAQVESKSEVNKLDKKLASRVHEGKEPLLESVGDLQETLSEGNADFMLDKNGPKQNSRSISAFLHKPSSNVDLLSFDNNAFFLQNDDPSLQGDAASFRNASLVNFRVDEIAEHFVQLSWNNYRGTSTASTVR